MALPQTPPRRKPGGMRASRPTFARLAAAAPFGRALATACRGGPWPSRRSLRCGKPGGTMRASSPTEVALSQGLRLPVWSQALASVRRGGFHIRPRSPAPPQTGPIWNRPLQGLRCGRVCGWLRGLPGTVGRAFTPAAPRRFKTVAFAPPQVPPPTARARKNEFPNTKKRPRHVAGPWFDTQGIHARKGCGRDGAGPPGGLRAGPDSGQLQTFTKWRPPPHRKAGLGQAGPQYTAVPGGGLRGGRS